MARASKVSPTRRPSRGQGRGPGRRVAGAVVGITMAAVLAGCATPYVSQQPGKPHSTGSSRGREIILVCESGTTTGANGVQTASSVALRVPAGTPVPPDCHLG